MPQIEEPVQNTVDTNVQNTPEVSTMPEASTETNASATESTTRNTTEAPAESYALVKDDRTGAKKIVKLEPNQETKQETPVVTSGQSEPTQNVFQKQEEPKPSYYTDAEMALALQLGNVDESKIPPAYAEQYAAVKQKMQAPPQNQPNEAPEPQKTDEQLRIEFLDKVNSMARERALKQLGITEEDLSVAEFSEDEELKHKAERFRAAMDITRNQVVSEYAEYVRAEKLKAEQAETFKNEVRSWIDEQRTSEPHFDEIGNYMQKRYQELPYKDVVNIAPAMQKALNGQLDPQSAKIIQKYYALCRKEFYANKNGTSITPSPRSPSVETKGTGADVGTPANYGERLRTASTPRERRAIVSAWINSMRK